MRSVMVSSSAACAWSFRESLNSIVSGSAWDSNRTPSAASSSNRCRVSALRSRRTSRPASKRAVVQLRSMRAMNRTNCGLRLGVT